MTSIGDLPSSSGGAERIETSTLVAAGHQEIHFDLLSFLSIAQRFNVDIIKITWQPALGGLGRGATALIQQAQVDASSHDSSQIEAERYRALSFELIALETLRKHPCVIDLLGVTWETDEITDQVWPVLLTERSERGNMAEFLMSEEGQGLTLEAKLGLCRDVADACKVMHDLGVIHGDIKLENVLVFLDTGHDQSVLEDHEHMQECNKLRAKVIDFGYSCFGTLDTERARVACTKPWQAPEHKPDRYFCLPEARKLDIYSFGMFLCRVFLPDTLTQLAQGDTGDDLKDEELERYERLEHLKQGSEFLSHIEAAADEVVGFTAEDKNKLIRLFRMTLRHDQRDRVRSFTEILSVWEGNSTAGDGVKPAENVVAGLAHEVLDLGKILADIDDEDYLLHRTIFENLKSRVHKGLRCACHERAARQLWLCYEIGFGTRRDSQLAAKYWNQATSDGTLTLAHVLREISDHYQCSSPLRLEQKLGYEVSLLFDPVTLYREQGRLKMAEKAFEAEVRARKASFGEHSRPYLSQLSLLATVVAANDKLSRAVDLSREAAEMSKAAYGMDDTETIGAFNYLSHMLFQLGDWKAVEELQSELIPCKERHPGLGPESQSTINSHNTLAAVYCLQGRYEDCLRKAKGLAESRRRELGPTHIETITAEVWVCRALLEKGEIEGLEQRTADMISANKRASGADDESTLRLEELLAAVLLSKATPLTSPVCESTLERALDLIREVLDRVEAPSDERTETFEPSDQAGEDDYPMNDALESEDENEVEIEDQIPTRPQIDLVLQLRAWTTLICILAVQGDFVNADEEIQDILADTEQRDKRETIERDRLTRVIQNVAHLKNLLEDAETSGQHHAEKGEEVRLIRWKLANRWSNL